VTAFPSLRLRARALASYRAPLAVVAVAVVLRAFFDDVTTFSRADETQYLLLTQRLAKRGFVSEYASIVREHLADVAAWDFPSPFRVGHFALTTLACHVARACTFDALTGLSTVAGVAAVGFAWLLGDALLGAWPATVGAALVALSPLQLALSRRALQDEEMCALALAALLTWVKLLRASRARPRVELAWACATCAIVALGLSVKTSLASYAPGFAVLWLLHARGRGLRRFDLVPLVAPVLYWAGFSWLNHDAHVFFTMLRVEAGALHQTYAVQYQSGAPHRYLVDLVALCPVSTLGALGALALLVAEPARDDTRGARQLAWLFGVTLATLSLAWAKTARFGVGLDALACLLCGWFVVRVCERASPASAWRWASGAIALAACVDLAIVERVFVTRAVYDPTTDGVLRALDMLPR
jgi:hypothetical protein